MSSGDFHADRMESIFSEDGWRDPSDDVERLAYYIFFALGGIAGLVAAVASGVTLSRFNPYAPVTELIPKGLLWTVMGIGLTLAISFGYFLYKESKRWSLKHLSAEKVVAGMFCFFIALLVICLWLTIESPYAIAITPYAAPIIITGLFLCYVVGLLCAYFPKWFPKTEVYENIFVATRYAIDDKAMVHENYETPYEDRMTGFVVLRASQGGARRIRATSSAYHLCQPGSVGKAKVINGVLREYKPVRLRVR